MLLLALLIASGVVYHLAQRASGAVSPWPMLAVAYGAAFALASLLAVTTGPRWQPGRAELVAGLAVGLAAFGIEAGFFFIYRSGWSLSSASVIANVSVSAILAIVGIAVFGEHLSAARATGLALAAVAAFLIARG